MRIKFRKWINTVLAVLLLVGMLPFRGTQTVAENTASPKISVIIPVYNVEPYLRQCLDSVVNQTLKELQIICINDGSTDSSLEILREYEKNDPRVIVIDQENKGGAAARNAGLDISEGEYISFVDADDYYIELNAYGIIYDKIKEIDADILMFGTNTVAQENAFAQNGLDACFFPGEWSLWNKLYKREFLTTNDAKLPEYAKAHHDECFNSRLLPRANGVLCINDTLYFHRRKRPGSIQTTLSGKKRAQYILVYANYVCDILKKNSYGKKYETYFLKKLQAMRNRVKCKLNNNDRTKFDTKLIELLRKTNIYNKNDIAKLKCPQ